MVCYPYHMDHDISYHQLRKIAGTQRRLAVILGLTEEHLSRISNGHRAAPAYMRVIAELLSALPHKDWPERWRQ